MASIQNITFASQGVNWKITFQYSEDNGINVPWESYTATFPADFLKLRDSGDDNVEDTMLGLARAVARADGIDV